MSTIRGSTMYTVNAAASMLAAVNRMPDLRLDTRDFGPDPPLTGGTYVTSPATRAPAGLL